MNATQALTRLRKLLGKGAEIHDHKRLSSPEEREATRAARMAAKAHKDECEAARVARLNAILAADPEYQRLKAARDAAHTALDKTSFGNYFRYSCGTVVGNLFFSVKAEGDTLAELVEKVEAQKVAA